MNRYSPRSYGRPEIPHPETLWLFDASKQLLVFQDAEHSQIIAWSESLLLKNAWNVVGIRMLPRCSVQ